MLIDNNEASQAPWILEAFPDATIKPLDIGDIASDDMNTIIERKSLDDLAASIIDGRYKDQVRTLMEVPSFVIITGKELSYRNKKKSPMVFSAINSLQYKYRIPTYRVETNEEFCKLAAKIIEKRSKLDPLDFVIKRRLNDPQLEMFASIAGIGGKRAKTLMEKFESIQNLCNASEQDIAEIEGLGPRTAELIYNSLKGNKI